MLQVHCIIDQVIKVDFSKKKRCKQKLTSKLQVHLNTNKLIKILKKSTSKKKCRRMSHDDHYRIINCCDCSKANCLPNYYEINKLCELSVKTQNEHTVLYKSLVVMLTLWFQP